MDVRTLALRRFILVALVIPAVVAGVGTAVQVIAVPGLGETVAVHWNAAGDPDGFAPAWTQPLMTVGIGFGVPALIALPALPGLRRGAGGPTYRLLGATATWTSIFVVTIFTWTTLAQTGGASADAVAIGRILVSALLIALAAGIGAWFAQPAVAARPLHARSVAPLPIEAHEHAVWVKVSTMTPVAMWALWASAALLLLAGGLMVIQQAEAGWIVAIVGVVMVVAVGATTTFRVAVTEAGMRVRSVWGVPRFGVAAADVQQVQVIEVNPMGEFGGWGVRAAPGRLGVVLRSGEAIKVTRRGGKSLLVTVDDAATGAALLESYARRAASDLDA
ncbi:DUF1648 domain-containing protein [Microbacterium sp. C7(2022)]|uniref:DUF1648 domain-containing protein n=1 Tax=Microbacterium sp. C7(2022) TaxID=2992759 RepID=UPI00237C1214|nr:DUF1648 domain-containing protein [Microbacterium sp. C7(2022)]MDE0545789.1 DUF1648 domain-containing protein [Microbacterium sp. C7(2022)]